VLWDLAPHDLSILLYWMDQSPTELCARGGAHVNRRVHDNVHLDLRFAEGAEAHVHLSWLEPSKVRRSTVVGTRKMVVYDDVAPAEKVWIYDRGVHVQYHTDNFDDFHLSYRYGNTTILHTPGDEPLQLEQKHFIGCIRERRRPKSDGFNGLRVVALMEDAQHSLAAGGVTVPVRPLVVDPPPELGSGLGPITQARAGRTARSNGIARDLVGERS
jgi:predicted dehydrogenase